MSSLNPRQFDNLILKLLENRISDEEVEELGLCFASDSNSINRYHEYVSTYAALQVKYGDELVGNNDLKEDGFDTDFWGQMAEYEKSAPELEIPEEKISSQLIQKVVYPPVERTRISRFQMVFSVVSAAAILLIVVLMKVVPPTQPPVVVARLTDQIDVTWDQKSRTPYDDGWMNQGGYALTEGCASILFNSGAKVTVEAPAKLALNSVGDMELLSGRIYAIVPGRAKGFSVMAGNTKIVDLGTEFGVEVDDHGNTQLHVMKGKTILFAGFLSGNKEQVSVGAGEAREVYKKGSVKKIPVAKDRFARQISSKSGLVLRNHKLNLADVIGGGNGFGTGTLEKGIDMVESRFQMFQGEKLKPVYIQDFSYKLFAGHPYIDGVCVPNGQAGPVKVSSQGHLFENCPPSTGKIWSGVMNGAFHFAPNLGVPRTQSSLGGTMYGTVSNPAIFMTPNQAVTFDLDAIRKDLNGVSIVSFSSKAGLSEALLKNSQRSSPKTSFCVLVDGVVRFKKIDQQATDDVLDVRVDLGPNDRFLTLVTLQGTDGRTDFECSLFGKPSLNLE